MPPHSGGAIDLIKTFKVGQADRLDLIEFQFALFEHAHWNALRFEVARRHLAR